MNQKNRIVIAICGIGMLFIIVCLLIMNSDVAKINRNLKLAQRDLLKEDYEDAINAFEAVIEMDPKNTEAYIGLAQAYMEMDDLERAIKLLERRSKRGDSKEIQELLDIYIAELTQRETLQETNAETAAIIPQPEPIEPEIAESVPSSEEPVVVNVGFMPQDGELYYYDEWGSIVIGWFEVGGSRYYAGTDGRLYRDGEYEVDSVKYLFDANGICLREIKDEAWKQAYIDHIRNNCSADYADTLRFWLIYINDDDIPEVVWTGDREGAVIMTYSNGILDLKYGNDFSYIKKKNLFLISEDASLGEGSFVNVIYSIVEGKMVVVSKGECEYIMGENGPNVRINEATTIGYNVIGENEVWEYRWNDKQVTKEEYDMQIRSMYHCDEADEMTDEPFYSYGKIIDVITNF